MKSLTTSTKALLGFRARLLRWYRVHGRDLPWRQTSDPYHIMVSEMMLQQTQVERVRERYERWLHRFPTVAVLAKTSPRAVLQEWSGLGYNRRALALLAAAQKIMHDYAGHFPTQPKELQKLPGIGPYTAHAIAVFAFKQSVPLVDTNIKRVLGRLFLGYKTLARWRDIDEPFWELSRQLLRGSRTHYEINQALMDFGATVCTAKQPRCVSCPMQSICQSYPEILQADAKLLRVKTVRTETLYFGKPRRIWRGKILHYLHKQPKHTATFTAIGRALQSDWAAKRLPWLRAVVATLEKDHMIQTIGQRVQLAK